MDNNPIEVTVLWFAALREHRGAASERHTVPAGTTAGGLFADLVPPEHRIPVACAVNRARVLPERALSDGDEVAFLPPLGGG